MLPRRCHSLLVSDGSSILRTEILQPSPIPPQVADQISSQLPTKACSTAEIGRTWISQVELELDYEYECGRPFLRVEQVQQDRYVKYLLPDVPMPENVTSFKSLKFSYLDTAVIQFMRQFQQNGLLANVNLAIAGKNFGWRNLERIRQFLVPVMKVLTHLLPLVDNFNCIDFMDSAVFDKIVGAGKNEQFYGLIKKILEQARFMGASSDSANMELHKIDLYCRWLYTPRKDGKPRVLYFQRYVFVSRENDPDFYRFIERIKQDFLGAKDPACFLIRVHLADWFEWKGDICLENGKNREKLSAKMQEIDLKPITIIGEPTDRVMLLISRYPMGAGKEWIEENEREAVKWDFCKQQRKIQFGDRLQITSAPSHFTQALEISTKI